VTERSGHRGDEGTSPEKRLRAAEYVRMSTEHQRYSTENQAEANADEGKSGLSIDGRDALKRLISDVDDARADFDTILVYDVSRWGRFQDADESAYYEYICKRAGITVQYCAQRFENDGSPVSTIVKGVKRAMAGEYSRELSAKVFAGQCRLIELGFRQGGAPGFGLRRALIDQSGAPKGELSRGEQKSIQTDRVVLAVEPEIEVGMVREIYRRFVEGRASCRRSSSRSCRRVGSPRSCISATSATYCDPASATCRILPSSEIVRSLRRSPPIFCKARLILSRKVAASAAVMKGRPAARSRTRLSRISRDYSPGRRPRACRGSRSRRPCV
jgi:DNA invertase Pin-like site-specific DNA recombinase